MGGDDARAVEGLDLQALRSWLDREVPGLVSGPLDATLITGGKSNLTSAVTDGSRALRLTSPPARRLRHPRTSSPAPPASTRP